MALFIKQFYTEQRLFTVLLILNAIVMIAYIYQDRSFQISNKQVLIEKNESKRNIKASLSRFVDASHTAAVKSMTSRPSRSTSRNATTSIPDSIDVVEGYHNLRNNELLRFQCGHCAIVTNSGQMLNSSAGSAIDSTECVLRMNGAPTKGYEKDVGSRTTTRIVGHSNIGKLKIFDSDMVIIPWLYSYNIDKDKDVFWQKAKNVSMNHTNVEFYLLSKDKVNSSEQIFNEETGISRKKTRSWMSTGWMTMIFALDVCDRIDVYGLVPENHCSKLKNWTNSTPYHYYDPEFKNECDYYNISEVKLLGGHKFLTEKAVYARWSTKYDINFYHPTWDTLDLNRNGTLDSPYLRVYQQALANGDMERALLELEKKAKKFQRWKKTKEILRKRKEARKKMRSKALQKKAALFKGRQKTAVKTNKIKDISSASKEVKLSKMTALRNFKNIDIDKTI